jgi:hypothetical protein
MMDQAVNVDTILPSLNLNTSLPKWIRGGVTLDGTAEDVGSGLSKVEISTDGGQTWQLVNGTTSWNFLWKTSTSSNGLHEVIVRAMDHAGLVARQTLKTGVDNKAPDISLPGSWYQWDTITLDVWDDHSGLSESRVEISDPQGRWPARIIQLNTAQFPMQFKWDRRFSNNTVAPDGKYDVKVTAVDQMGNESVKTASLKVLVDILPPGPTATLQPPSRPSSTPTVLPSATFTPINTPTQAIVVKVFGSTPVPEAQATPKSESAPSSRLAPTQTSVIDWLESIFMPDSGSAQSTTEIVTLGEISDSQTATGSNVLWAASAAAMIGSMTAYALDEKRKKQEERERRIAEQAEEQERREKKRAKRMAKLEAKWAQERAWEEARLEQERLASEKRMALYIAHSDERMLRLEAEDEARWIASRKAIQERYEAKKRAEEERQAAEVLQAGLAAYYNARKEGETTAPVEKPWWEKGLDWVDSTSRK